MSTTTALSVNAQKLYNALKNGSLYEGKAIDTLFPAPKYVGTLDPNYSAEEIRAAQIAYWQHDINYNGIARTRPVLGESIMFEPTANYSKAAYEAWKELKDAGLAASKNHGYNEFSYFLIK